jgi:hypothetical protein
MAGWMHSCIQSTREPSNLLSFAVNLRGMIESSLDANYSLGPVAKTLADNHSMVEASLKGTLDGALIIQEMEDRLIHFVYGRKIAKTDKDMFPASHVALEPREYRSAIGCPKRSARVLRSYMTRFVVSATQPRFHWSFCGIRQPEEMPRLLTSAKVKMKQGLRNCARSSNKQSNSL